MANALVAGGLARGDRVGIAMRNSPSWIALYMGTLIAGGVAVLLNGWWQPEEFAAALTEVECSIVFADPPRGKRLAEVAGLTAQVVVIDDLQPLAQALAPVSSDAAADLPELGPDDLATILFTSGSTGQCEGRAQRSSRGDAGGAQLSRAGAGDARPRDRGRQAARGPAVDPAQRAAVPRHRRSAGDAPVVRDGRASWC